MNLTKSDGSRVDIEARWFYDQLYITLTRTDLDLGTSCFEFSVDDTDLEHFISTLIEFQR